ncbi:MAG: glycyl-radical enzyme activating protein [Treponema sp.]|jgi:pyruvate formate lyase activating enzyme|nr:glycyl-radical enzyme activating protein [Treponema sp.]
MPVQGVLFNIQKFSIHDGPGIRTVVFFKGCPLRCAWCSNPESQDPEVRPLEDPSLGGKCYSIEEAMEICLQDRAFYEESGGGVTLSGGEVLSQADFAEALLVRLGEAEIHRAIETSGHAPPGIFARIAAQAELILFDIKHHDDGRHREETGAAMERIQQNFRAALAAAAAGRGPRILPRIPVIPGYNDSPDDAAAFASLLRATGADTVQLLPFHQFGRNKYALLGREYGLAQKKALHQEDLADFATAFARQGVKACF